MKIERPVKMSFTLTKEDAEILNKATAIFKEILNTCNNNNLDAWFTKQETEDSPESVYVELDECPIEYPEFFAGTYVIED